MDSRTASSGSRDATATVYGPGHDLAVDRGLAAFVGEHYDRLLRLARLICRDGTDAADAVQTGLEQAWRHRGSLRDGDRLSPWLDRIVVRAAIRVSDRRRSWLRRILSTDTGVAWAEPSRTEFGEDATWLSLDVAFEGLSPEQRAVVALHLHAGYSILETAEIVRAPVETVRSRLRLAREKLRKALEEQAS
jgi:RNA polymerase sigma-70 factor (ECF subfamily)